MHVLTIVGARPQFIKAGPVSIALAAAGCRETLLHTGQHYDRNMSDVFFAELALPDPHIHLGTGSGSHAQQTAAMLTGIEREIQARKPDGVLVYGDTNSTLAGALAAVKLHLPVFHIEAGLRSFNWRMPEEINRILVDRISRLLFTPTIAASRNLLQEGRKEDCVRLVGDVMLDAIHIYFDKASQHSRILSDLGLVPKSYVLVTIHRAENTDRPEALRMIVEALEEVARELPVVFPVHPRTRKVLENAGASAVAGVRLIEPVGFLDMHQLEAGAAVIATDSGGVQKEAFWHGVPCVTLRHETEWVELVEAGCNQICPPVSVEAISKTILRCIGQSIPCLPLYGDGNAAVRIAQDMAAYF
jgi:UDP-GlcNAc3NAcA epimerase